MASRRGLALAALVPLLLAGCTASAEHVVPADVAADVLGQFVDDATLVSGFTISETRITVTSGEPPATQQVHPTPDEPTEPVAEPAYPPWVRGSEFPVDEAVARATGSLAGCGDVWGMVEVQVLSATGVATRTTCEVDGQEVHSVLLNDDSLGTVDEPVSAETVQLVWDEIEAAGLAEDVLLVAIDRDADVARIQFAGPTPDRTYEWNRGLTEPDSRVLSHPSPVPGQLDLTTVTADVVAAALDEELAALGGPDTVERVLVQPASDGDGAELLLTDVDYMPLATVQLG